MIDERKQLDDRASVGFCKKGFISHIIMCKIYIYMIKKVTTILQRNKKKMIMNGKKMKYNYCTTTRIKSIVKIKKYILVDN